MSAFFLQYLELLFGWLLAASWQASVLALFVLILQRLLGARLNPRWRYALWLLVLVRLVLPALPESSFSVYRYAPATPPIDLRETIPTPVMGIQVSATGAPPIPIETMVPETNHLFLFLSLLWLIGAISLLILTWLVNHRFARQVAHSPSITDPEILRLFAETKTELGITRSIRLIESTQVQSPAIMGLFSPTLLLPGDVRQKFDARELRFIFLHELAHLKRGDVIAQALIALLQILHWFNPVLWYAFRRMRIDREPATDALVLSRAGEAEKERYGLMLIKLLEHFNQRHSLPTLVGILEDKDQFKRRFGLIAKFTRGAYGWSLLGVLLIALLAIAGLTQAHRAAFKRDPALPLELDLKPFYTRVFQDPAGTDSEYQGYTGPKTIDGLPFDIGGNIALWGKENADRNSDYPKQISGIKIDRKFDELHLIHTTRWREYHGCPVALIRLNYADGTNVEFPICFGVQVIDWSRLYTEDAEVITDPDTKIIWRGPGSAEGTGRLPKSILRNPFPDKKVTTMDVTSTGSGCSYVLVAATVAQTEPDRAVTPPMPLLPARHFLGHLKVHVVDKKTGASLAGAEIYPAMITGDISLVADNLLTSDDGSAVVDYPTGAETVPAGSGDANDPKYPKSGAKDLRLRITKAGYENCEIHWQSGWDASEVPQEITYHLTPQGDTTLGNLPDFTVIPSDHPTLLAAVKQGDAVSLQKLIDQGTDPSQVEDQGNPLIFSAGSPEVVDILLQHGANPNARNQQGTSVLTYFCRNRDKQAAALAGVLLAHGADPNGRNGEIGDTPLMEAQDGATVDVLVAHGADLNAKTTNGMSIISAVGNKPPDYLDALIRHGVPFDLKTDGPSALIHAAWISNLPLINTLLQRGVDPNLAGVWYIRNGTPEMMKPLEAAVVDGQTATVKLLLDHGANADDSMLSALHNRRADIVKLFWEHGVRNISELCYDVSQNAPVGDLQKLLDGGVPTDPPQDKIFSPLALASQLGNLEAVKLLVSRGADVNKSPVFNPKFPIYKTSALVLASSEGQAEIVSYLLAHDAQPNPEAVWQAAENSTPYNNQRPKEDFEKCVRILLDAGSLKNATPEEKGYVLASALGTRQGPPNAAVLKMVLDAGISPEVPMPYVVANGEKPNTVIGYYRKWYQKNKADPGMSPSADRLKPLLDLLEAADKTGAPKSDTGTQPSAWPPPDLAKSIGFIAFDNSGEINRPTASDLNATIDNLKLTSLDIPTLPLHQYLNELAKVLKQQNPDSQQVTFILMCPQADKPYPITFHLQHPSGLREVMSQLNKQYPLRYQIRGPTDIIVWQIESFETLFNQRAQETKIDLNLDHATLAEALKTVQAAAASQGFFFNVSNFADTSRFPSDAPHNITLQQNQITLDQTLRSILTTSHALLVYQAEKSHPPGEYYINLGPPDVPAKNVTTGTGHPTGSNATENASAPQLTFLMLGKPVRLSDASSTKIILQIAASFTNCNESSGPYPSPITDPNENDSPTQIEATGSFLHVLYPSGQQINTSVGPLLVRDLYTGLAPGQSKLKGHGGWGCLVTTDQHVYFFASDRKKITDDDLLSNPDILAQLIKSGIAKTIAADQGTSKDTTSTPALNNQLLDVVHDQVRADKNGIITANKVAALLAQGADPDAKDDSNVSALVWAVNFGEDDAAQLLLQHGADFNVTDSTGATAARSAASFRVCPGALDLMIKKGLDVNQPDAKGRTVVDGLSFGITPRPGVRDGFYDHVITQADDDARSQRVRRVVDLLAVAGADLNRPDPADGKTPLMKNIQSGNFAAARALIEHGVKTDPRDAIHQTALGYLIYFAPFNTLPLDLLQTLLDHGGNSNEKFDGQPMLQLAMDLSPARDAKGNVWPPDPSTNFKAVQLLLIHGADPMQKNTAGQTAFDLAKKSHPEFLPLLSASTSTPDATLNIASLNTHPPQAENIVHPSTAETQATPVLIAAVDPPTPTSAAELEALQKNLLAAREDANLRRVILNSVQNLPDDQFLLTLQGMDRSNPATTSLQKEITDKEAAITDLLKGSFSEDHPRVVAARAELASLQQDLRQAIAGQRKAMTLDSQMADARAALLTDQVAQATAAMQKAQGAPAATSAPIAADSPSDLLTVRTYLAPANFLGITKPGPDGKTLDVTKLLADLGFQFPDGASAAFILSSNKLVVRDTPDQLDRLVDYINQLSPPTTPASDPRPMIRVGFKVLQIKEDDYQAHRAEIDAAVQGGDAAALTHQDFVQVLSEPAVLVKAGEQGVLEAVRVFPYATKFQKGSDGKLQPTDFARKDLGVRFILSPFTMVAGQINLNGELSVTNIEKWNHVGDSVDQPVFLVRKIAVASLLNSGETKGYPALGDAQIAPLNASTYYPTRDQPNNPVAPRRLFLFLTAYAYSGDGAPLTVPPDRAKLTGFVTLDPAQPINADLGAADTTLSYKLQPMTAPVNTSGTTIVHAADPHEPPQIQIELKVSEIDDDVYLANKEKIDTAIDKGGPEIIGLLNNLNGVSLLSAPSVTTKPGLKANIDIVREFPYPTSFSSAKVFQGLTGTGPSGGKNLAAYVPATPREFTTKDVGVSAEILPTISGDKIDVSCTLRITDFDGFIETNQALKSPAFEIREANFLEEFGDGTEIKGAMVPGVRLDEKIVTDRDAQGKIISQKTVPVKKRLIVFLSARLISPEDGSTITTAAINPPLAPPAAAH